MNASRGISNATVKKILNKIGYTDISSSGSSLTGAISNLQSHADSKSNPHGVTKSQVGLGNCDNTADSAKSVKYATSAGNADTVDGHHFNWSGKSGQPSWLWGGNDSTNMYVYNPSNFSVNYATSAGSAVDQTARNSASSANSNANNRVAKSGDTMSGALNMNKNDIKSCNAIYSVSNGDWLMLLAGAVQSTHPDWSNRADVLCDNLHYSNSLTKDSYRGVKENITPAAEERIRKILDVPVQIFDYRAGFCNGKKDVVGMIVDEVQGIIPEAVRIPDNWDETKFNELLGEMGNSEVPGIDQTTFIPYLIGMVQLLNKEVEELKKELKEKEN